MKNIFFSWMFYLREKKKIHIFLPQRLRVKYMVSLSKKWINWILYKSQKAFYKLKRVQYQLSYYLTLLSGWIVWKQKITVAFRFLGFIYKMESFFFFFREGHKHMLYCLRVAVPSLLWYFSFFLPHVKSGLLQIDVALCFSMICNGSKYHLSRSFLACHLLGDQFWRRSFDWPDVSFWSRLRACQNTICCQDRIL